MILLAALFVVSILFFSRSGANEASTDLQDRGAIANTVRADAMRDTDVTTTAKRIDSGDIATATESTSPDDEWLKRWGLLFTTSLFVQPFGPSIGDAFVPDRDEPQFVVILETMALPGDSRRHETENVDVVASWVDPRLASVPLPKVRRMGRDESSTKSQIVDGVRVDVTKSKVYFALESTPGLPEDLVSLPLLRVVATYSDVESGIEEPLRPEVYIAESFSLDEDDNGRSLTFKCRVTTEAGLAAFEAGVAGRDGSWLSSGSCEVSQHETPIGIVEQFVEQRRPFDGDVLVRVNYPEDLRGSGRFMVVRTVSTKGKVTTHRRALP